MKIETMRELSLEEVNLVAGADRGDAGAGGFVAGALAGGGLAFSEMSAAGYAGAALIGGTLGIGLVLGIGMAGAAIVVYNMTK